MFLPSFRQLQTRPQNSVKHPLRFLHALRPIYGDSTCIRFFLEDKVVFHVHWLIYLGCCTRKSSTLENLWQADTALQICWRSSYQQKSILVGTRIFQETCALQRLKLVSGTPSCQFQTPCPQLHFDLLCVASTLIYHIANLATSQYGRASHGGGTVGCHMSLTPAQWRKRHPCRCPSTWMSHPAWSLRHCKVKKVNCRKPKQFSWRIWGKKEI